MAVDLRLPEKKLFFSSCPFSADAECNSLYFWTNACALLIVILPPMKKSASSTKAMTVLVILRFVTGNNTWEPG